MDAQAALDFARAEIERAKGMVLSDLIDECEAAGVATAIATADWREAKGILGARLALAKLRKARESEHGA